ncbi:MAG: hypothetical protein WCS43_13620 [Verrucomicrobiota bacterium]
MRSEAITLDTNVLEHFFRTETGGMNADGHITALLTKVIEQRRTLYFDTGNRLATEMTHRLDHYKKHREMGNFQNVFRGLGMLPKQTVPVDHQSGLMLCIDRCVPGHTEQSDKVIVFVAVMSDTVLVSNNDRHITNHATCLKKCAKRHAKTKPEFWNSQTANANI